METVGSLIDKLSINELKIYHMKEQMMREGKDEEFYKDCDIRLNILNEQREDLIDELQKLMDDVMAGRRTFKLYRQLKMYNERKYQR